jgi:hypothetical protein
LVRANGFNELMAYDLTQDFSDEFKPSYLIPLDYNINIIPQHHLNRRFFI